ncbi:hypothetical protein SUGI_0130900 [Cryptomeria japonica]|nr:hypothetical protein SUGI_0130900 [Cryptomeria japonica]
MESPKIKLLGLWVGFSDVANKDFSYVKEKVEEVDKEKLVYRYSHVEGGLLGKKVASTTYEYKYTPKVGGRCICSSVVHFDILSGVPHDKEKVKEIKEMSTALFKKIEAYLIVNPSLFC